MAHRKQKKGKNSPSLKQTPGKTTSAFKWKERRSIVLFWLSFAAIVIAYLWFSAQPFYIDHIFNPVVLFFSNAGSLLLNIFNMGTNATDAFISGDGFTLNIGKGCDGLAPIMLFVAAVLVYPLPFRLKWKALFLGIAALLVLNLVRIVSLYLTGIYAPGLFDVMHLEVWQALFIIAAIGMWLYWLNWATIRNQSHAS